MANIVRMQIFNKRTLEIIGGGKLDDIIETPLLDDITVSAKSAYTKLGELIPLLGQVKETGMGVLSSVSNTIGAKWIDMGNKIDAPRWQSTEPLRLSYKVSLYTKSDPYKDVVLPAMLLNAQSILTKDGDNYITPGISLATVAAYGQEGDAKKNDVITASKLISVEIPGIVYIPLALVESAIPTYSKHVTESGHPFWASIDMQILSVLPANTDYFLNAVKKRKRDGMIAGGAESADPKAATKSTSTSNTSKTSDSLTGTGHTG